MAPNPAIIPVTPGSGINLDATQVSVNSQNVDREVVVIGDPSTGSSYAGISTADPGTSDPALTVRNVRGNAGLPVVSTLTGSSNNIGAVTLTGGANTVGTMFLAGGPATLTAGANIVGTMILGGGPIGAGANTIGNVIIAAGANAIGAMTLTAGANTIGLVTLSPNTVNTSIIASFANVNSASMGPLFATAPQLAQLYSSVAATAYPSSVGTNGQVVPSLADKAGRQIIVASAPREMIGTANVLCTTTSSTNLVPAGGAGVFNDISTLVLTNANQTATLVTLSDSNATGKTYTFALASGGGLVSNFPTPLPQSNSNATWNISANPASNIYATVAYVGNK